MNHVLLVLDSCRFDAVKAAQPRNLLRLGRLERRWSYATWTAPSHYNLLMGLYPHADAPRLAADTYRQDLGRLAERLGLEPSALAESAPTLWMPDFLRSRGFFTGASVAMPVLHPGTPIARGFHHYQLMPRHDDLATQIRSLRFYKDRPSFWLLNAGETHYPYGLADLPRLHGFHGVVRRLRGDEPASEASFDAPTLRRLQEAQIEALLGVDRLLDELYALLPAGTWLTITSDHGELFGEGGRFGHGPFRHPKLLEVFLVEGRIG